MSKQYVKTVNIIYGLAAIGKACFSYHATKHNSATGVSPLKIITLEVLYHPYVAEIVAASGVLSKTMAYTNLMRRVKSNPIHHHQLEQALFIVTKTADIG